MKKHTPAAKKNRLKTVESGETPPAETATARASRAGGDKQAEKQKAMLAKANELLQSEIARRRKAESMLRSSNVQFAATQDAHQRESSWLQGLIAATQDAVVGIDRDGKIAFFNPAAERVFGYGRSEVIGRKVNMLMAEPYAAEHDGYVQRYEATGEARAIGRIRTVAARRKNGEIFPIELSVTKVAAGESGDVRYGALIRDISDLRRSQAWLETLIEKAQDAVLSIDSSARVVLFNPAAERMFGYGKDEVIGQKVNLLMAEPYAAEHDSYIERYEKTGEARAIGRIRTVEARRKDGGTFPIELSVTAVPTPEGTRYAAFIRDITEKTRLQQQALDNERLAAIGSTAAKLAHEIGNPLNGMFVTTQLLERRLRRIGAADETTDTSLRNLQKELSRLNEMLNEYRALYRREKYALEPTALAELVEETLALEGSNYSAAGIAVENKIPGDLPPISADREKLKQVLINLLKNAAEAMPAGGSVTFTAHASGGQTVLEVQDTGVGIPAGVDIFAPFVTSKPTGTGLGLVIVRQILTAHGATITYSSEPEKGTKFRLSFPANIPIGHR